MLMLFALYVIFMRKIVLPSFFLIFTPLHFSLTIIGSLHENPA